MFKKKQANPRAWEEQMLAQLQDLKQIRDDLVTQKKVLDDSLHQKHAESGERTKQLDEARAKRDCLWAECDSARQAMCAEISANDAVWDEFRQAAAPLTDKICELEAQITEARTAMTECFSKAHEAYDAGRKAEAAEYSAEGNRHKATRDALIKECKSLKDQKEKLRDKIYSKLSRGAKSQYYQTKDRHYRAKVLCEKAERECQEIQAAIKGVYTERNLLYPRLKRCREAVNEARTRLQEAQEAAKTSDFDADKALDEFYKNVNGIMNEATKVSGAPDGSTESSETAEVSTSTSADASSSASVDSDISPLSSSDILSAYAQTSLKAPHRFRSFFRRIVS